MGNKFGLNLKVLAVLTALVMIASSVAMYSGTDVEKGISESGGKGVISLEAPSFVSIASASEVKGGGGGGTPRAGTTFLEEEAGISAYVNVGQEIDLEKAETAFKSIETTNESYIIGEIDLQGLPENVNPHAYVHADGWIVTYYSNYQPASKVMEWYEYDGGKITTTTLADAIQQICDEIEVQYAIIKDDIKYYDFEYPNANRLMLITDMYDSFSLTIPVECWLYEGSWSHYFSVSSPYPYFHTSTSYLKIDGDTISTISGITITDYNYGEYTSKQLEAGILHGVSLTQKLGHVSYHTAGVATVLIYRTS